MVLTSKINFIKQASWPESCPKPEEKNFISIGTGNSTIHWAFHAISRQPIDLGRTEIQPNMTWITPQIMEEDEDANIPNLMASLVPKSLQDYFFGKADKVELFTEDMAKEEAKKRGSEITFYIVSSNDKIAERIGKILSCIPCRVYLMQGEDFYPKSCGRYDGMGVDRCACLKGGVSVHGPPLLVIDGGSAMTYTAVDSKGRIIGGGISPGLSSKLKSMHQDTGALPLIDFNHVHKKLKTANETKPLSIFSKNTEEAMIVAVLNEIVAHYQTVVKIYQEKITAESNRNDTNQSKVKIIVTGGNGELIANLLKPNSENRLLESSRDLTDVNVIFEKALLHLGIGAVIEDKVNNSFNPKPNTTIKNGLDNESKYDLAKYRKFVGQRVAKYFDEPCKYDNDHIYRGQIYDVEMINDVPIYSILYDDEDTETTPDIDEMIKLFKDVGEKKMELYIGKKIATHFPGHGNFAGTVESYDGWFHVKYDDDDEQDMDLKEVQQGIDLYNEHFT